MAKIDRYNGNLEAPASAALGTERTIFGTGSQSDDLTDQFNAFLLRGWGIVGPSDQPTLQDFNAMGFTLGQIHAYLHQMGVAEYNATQEYHIGSIANVAGVLYVSLVDTNVGNAPASSPAQWRNADHLDSVRIDVASATNVNLTTAAPNTRNINITGTTTITGFTVEAGKTYFVRFAGALTLANGASLVTQDGSNIITEAGDTCIIRSVSANAVEVICGRFKSQLGIGYGQTTQDVTGSRLSGVTYTNSTQRAIMVSVRGLSGPSALINVQVGDAVGASEEILVQRPADTDGVGVQFIVPAGQQYRVSLTNITLSKWKELR